MRSSVMNRKYEDQNARDTPVKGWPSPASLLSQVDMKATLFLACTTKEVYTWWDCFSYTGSLRYHGNPQKSITNNQYSTSFFSVRSFEHQRVSCWSELFSKQWKATMRKLSFFRMIWVTYYALACTTADYFAYSCWLLAIFFAACPVSRGGRKCYGFYIQNAGNTWSERARFIKEMINLILACYMRKVWRPFSITESQEWKFIHKFHTYLFYSEPTRQFYTTTIRYIQVNRQY